MSVRISAIAAVARNRVIGRDNKLPWHIPDDLKNFRRLTMGKPLVLGRKTFDSFGGKPLPGRPHVIMTRTPLPDRPDDNIYYAADVSLALDKARQLAAESGADEIFVAGGADVYKQAFPFIERFYLTRIEQEYDGDAFLDLDFSGWTAASSGAFAGPPPYTITVFDRV